MNDIGQQKSTIKADQSLRKSSQAATTRACPGSYQKVTRSSTLAAQLDASSSQKPTISSKIAQSTAVATTGASLSKNVKP